MTVFTEQLELQFLSDELDIAITDLGENPRLEYEEIYETPQAPTKPAIGLTCNQSCHSVVPTLDDLSSNSSPWSDLFDLKCRGYFKGRIEANAC
uniref:Uncharacterized protein n=1 Tax=Quercus lobata TaxID=97700 RepID=A0A7N2MUZ2_QUELO